MAEYSEIELRGNPKPLSGALEQAFGYVRSFLSDVTGAFERTLDALDLSYSSVMQKLTKGISDFEATAARTQQIELILRRIGDHAGHTAEQLASMRVEIRKISSASLDEIMAAQRDLLKYTRIRFPVFEEVLRTADEMKQVWGTDLSSAADRLGDALNNPIEALDKLREHLTDMPRKMKDQIRWWAMTGDVQKAQLAILQELNKAYGGSGAAAANTFGAKMAKIREETDKMWESIAGALLPYLQKVVDAYNHIGRVVSKVVSQWVQGGVNQADTVEMVYQFVISAIKKIIDYLVIGFSAAQAVYDNWSDYWTITWEYMKAAAYLAAAEILRGVVWLTGAIQQLWAKAVEIFAAVWKAIAEMAAAVWKQIVEVAAAAWNFVVEAAMAAGEGLMKIWEGVTDYIAGVFKYMAFRALFAFNDMCFGIIKAIINLAMQVPNVWSVAVDGMVLLAKGIWTAVTAIFTNLWERAKTMVNNFLEFPKTVGEAAFQIVNILVAANTFFTDFLKELWDQGQYWLDKLKGKAAEEPEKKESWMERMQKRLKEATGKMGAELEELKNKFNGMEGFELPEFEMPEMPDLNAMADELEKLGKEALAKAQGIDPGFAEAFQKNLDANRAKIEEFYKWFEENGVDPAGLKTDGTAPGRMKGILDESLSTGQSTAGRFEDLKSLNQRIQSSAARPPELDELRKQTALMQMQNRYLWELTHPKQAQKQQTQYGAYAP